MEISICSFTDPSTTIWLLQNFYLLSPTPGLPFYAFYFECCERYLADSLASILFLWRVYDEFNSRLLSSLQWATTENPECLRLSVAALNLSHMGKFKGSARFIWFCHFPAAAVVSNSVLSTCKFLSEVQLPLSLCSFVFSFLYYEFMFLGLCGKSLRPDLGCGLLEKISVSFYQDLGTTSNLCLL